MQILIFGVGKIYQENKKHISCDDKIIAFLDNNSKLWRTEIDNIPIYSPADISDLYYDKIVLMSIYAEEMREQLLSLGCKREDIIHYKEYIAKQSTGELQIFFCDNFQFDSKKKCLIISDILGYHGGALAAVYAAEALKSLGYEVVVAAPNGNPIFIKEMRKKGISFILSRNLIHAKENDLVWINSFQYIIVNTLPMICCAVELAKRRRVILWLHESLNIYRNMEYWNTKIKNGITTKRLEIYAVSSIARNNFAQYYPGKQIQILPYGIPDETDKQIKRKHKKLVFATIGTLNEQKGQDIFLDAIEKVIQNGGQGEFWFIGKNPLNTYGQLIEKRAAKNKNIRFIEELTRAEIKQYYSKIDILVVASREETMSIVATEAMMQGKVCIISDAAGMSDYIQDYFNGLVFENANSNELAKRILWCIKNPDKLKKIGIEAKLIYEKQFSMYVFGKNLEAIICEEQ